MKIIIPAAGEGLRLRPHTLTKPKPILPLAGKTIIEFIIDELNVIENIEEIIFIVGYKKEYFTNYIKENIKGYNFSFVEQKEYRGLGDAVYLAKERIKDDDEILIILGDTIFEADIKAVVKSKENMLGCYTVDDPKRFGVVVLNDDETISKLVEKPQEYISNLALTGVYSIKKAKKLFDAIKYIIENDIKTKNEYQLTDALDCMIKYGEVFKTFKLTKWYDCGVKETMLKTNKQIIKHNLKSKNIVNSTIIEPVYLGENVSIEGSVVGPYVHVGNNTKIKSSIIRSSIIDENVSIENALLADTIFSENAVYKGGMHSLDLGNSDVRSIAH